VFIINHIFALFDQGVLLCLMDIDLRTQVLGVEMKSKLLYHTDSQKKRYSAKRFQHNFS
jgi:hypothetical protein